MSTFSQSARLMTVTVLSAFATLAAYAEDPVHEVPLEHYTSYPSLTPTATAGPTGAPQGVYQNGMVVPMVFAPRTTMTYSPHYTINGNGSSILVPSFPMGGAGAMGGGVVSGQPVAPPMPAGDQTVVPNGGVKPEPVKAEPEKVVTAAKDEPGKGAPPVEQAPAEPPPAEPPKADKPAVASDDNSDFSKRAKFSIKGHVTAHVNSIRANTIMKDFGDTLQRTETVWGVGPDGKRTNDFCTIITFFEARRGPHGVRACKTITNGKLVPNREKKVMDVVLEPTETPKFCVVFKDGKRTRISALDGSVLAGEAREDAVPAEQTPVDPPKTDPKPAPPVAPPAEAPQRQDGPAGAK